MEMFLENLLAVILDISSWCHDVISQMENNFLIFKCWLFEFKIKNK